jgi:hypothetical protein
MHQSGLESPIIQSLRDLAQSPLEAHKASAAARAWPTIHNQTHKKEEPFASKIFMRTPSMPPPKKKESDGSNHDALTSCGAPPQFHIFSESLFEEGNKAAATSSEVPQRRETHNAL